MPIQLYLGLIELVQYRTAEVDPAHAAVLAGLPRTGLPRRCAPADKHRTQASFDPSTGHQRSDRFRVHMPMSQPTARLMTTLVTITIAQLLCLLGRLRDDRRLGSGF